MSTLIHLLIVCVVLAVLVYVAQSAPIPEPFRWIAWVVVFLVALLALLPFLGIHVPA
jgi:ABC-type multidrug transport system permease subunit